MCIACSITCNTESDLCWGWFWVWDRDYFLLSSMHPLCMKGPSCTYFILSISCVIFPLTHMYCRRVNYILRNSPHTHTSKQLVIKGSKPKSTTSSKNKVWIASSGTDTCPSDAEEPAVRPLQKFTTGRESKTRQGNKQWVASGISKPRSVRSAQKVHTKKQPGLRTPTATSSRVVMDASGRRMIRIPSSSRLTWKRASVSGTPSINRMLAR